jgi:hypothetical protein
MNFANYKFREAEYYEKEKIIKSKEKIYSKNMQEKSKKENQNQDVRIEHLH